ncbi:MAG: efflux RND transporter periplasmic adaptor subunit [Acidobacteriales bacterium]|nr:efflux RND transporter periplasmic adaptor subunit [Terriglobales bacterium]
MGGCVLLCLLQPACSRAPNRTAETGRPDRVAVQPSPERKTVRTTGLIQALESQSIRVPQISGTGNRMTLTRLIPNGSKVSKGEMLAEFDRTTILDEERDTKAKVDDLSHQWEEKKAQVNSDAAKRVAQLREAEADLEKAQLQLRKGPVLSEIDRLKNEAKAENARVRLASLRKSDECRRRAEEAAVKILELKRQRQQVSLERIQSNLERLQVRAPLDGMIVLENTWRSGSMGPAQVGDQMWPGMPLVRIFNPARMIVVASVNEPDIASLWKSPSARLYLDAYPGAVFEAILDSANPVATAGMDSQVRTFNASFRIVQQSPLLLPDLSAALEIDTSTSTTAASAAAPAAGAKP